MATTIDVYPASRLIPTFGALIGEGSEIVNGFLARYGVSKRPRLYAEIHSKGSGARRPVQATELVQWERDQYAWFAFEGIGGGTDAGFRDARDVDYDFLLGEIEWSDRAGAFKDRIRETLSAGHYWWFRRSAGQPGIINIAYGLLAAALARLTGGFLSSSDSAWESARLPSLPDEFIRSYMRPELAGDESFREWSERCVAGLEAELKDATVA